jgi:hypothetical protein
LRLKLFGQRQWIEACTHARTLDYNLWVKQGKGITTLFNIQ